MKTQTKLFIFSTNEGEVYYETILESEFDAWIERETDGIDPQEHPIFKAEPLDAYSGENDYCIIRGEVVVPKSVKVVTRYKL